MRQSNGDRGGQYYVADLSDGRVLTVSRKPGDNRVWLGSPDDLSTFRGQRGGVGTIDKMLDEWRAKLALTPRCSSSMARSASWLPRSARQPPGRALRLARRLGGLKEQLTARQS